LTFAGIERTSITLFLILNKYLDNNYYIIFLEPDLVLNVGSSGAIYNPKLDFKIGSVAYSHEVSFHQFYLQKY
jgi:nucleoside phosphorylase